MNKKLTDTDINKAVALKLGIEWHERTNAIMFTDFFSCSCGYQTSNREDFINHIKESNPDFTLNAKDLIEIILQRDDLKGFALFFGFGLGDIELKYVLNSRLLCERFLEWEGK